MRFQGSLACLLLALCLGRGEAGPLLSGGAGAEAGVGEALGHGVEEVISHGIGEVVGEGVSEAVSSGIKHALGPGVSEALSHKVGEAVYQGAGEAAHAIGKSGGEAGRQAETIIRHGIDAAHNAWQGQPGGHGAWVSGRQEARGGDGGLGSWVENLGNQLEGRRGLLLVAVWGGFLPLPSWGLHLLSPCRRWPLSARPRPSQSGTVPGTNGTPVVPAGDQWPAFIWRPGQLRSSGSPRSPGPGQFLGPRTLWRLRWRLLGPRRQRRAVQHGEQR